MNMFSFLIGNAIRQLNSLWKYKILVAYADDRLHSGTVYRACNWTDLGLCAPDYE
jgi:hypothetical protein